MIKKKAYHAKYNSPYIIYYIYIYIYIYVSIYKLALEASGTLVALGALRTVCTILQKSSKITTKRTKNINVYKTQQKSIRK